MKSPYLLISLLFLVSFTYLVTWSLYKLLIIKRNLHQKIWNVILLITFLIVAILGLLLAGQVNYKWEIQNIDKIVNWHVNFGIALAAVSIFHLLWHWSYYKNIFKKNKEKSNNKISDKLVVEEELPEDIHEKPISYQLILLGFSSIISQLVIIREFLSILSGNELLIGILFSNWMIITGLGAILGKNSYKLKNQFKFINSVIIAFPLISIAIIFAVNIFKNLVFHPGSIISIFQIFYSSFILLLPLCFLGGYLFTLLAFRFSESKKANTIDKSYGIEALGSVIGGIIFNFILVYFFKSIQILSIVIILNCLFIYFFINNSYPKIKQYILVILVLLISVTFLVIDFDTKAKKVLYRNQEIIHNENSPFGNIVITRNGDQLNFFENAVLYFSTDNVIENEEIVHYTMLQKENIENVLLISGGIKGLIDEILKYDIKSIDYVEINPRIIKIGRKYISFLDNKKLKIIERSVAFY